jgi:hypothetical protein
MKTLFCLLFDRADKAIYPSKTSVNFHQSARCRIQKVLFNGKLFSCVQASINCNLFMSSIKLILVNEDYCI